MTPNALSRRNRRLDDKVSLWTLLENFYLPERYGPKSSVVYQCRVAVKWLGYSLGRNAVLADLAPDNFRALYKYMAERGRAPGTVENYRKRLAGLLSYAVERKLVVGEPFVPHIDPSDDGKAKPAQWTEAGTLAHYYASTFKPTVLFGLRPSSVVCYDAAVNAYMRFAGGDVRVADLSDERIMAFAAWLRDAGRLSENVVGRYPQAVRRILREFNPPAVLPMAVPTIMRPDTPAGDGTLREFFERYYMPEHPIKHSTEYQYRLLIKKYSEHLGREAMLSDLNAPAINAFLVSRLAVVTARSVRGDRHSLVGFWKSAADWGLLSDFPRRVRKIKAEPVLPDAWSVGELTSLLAATGDARFDCRASGIHVGRFLNAIARTAYDTALRCGDLLAVTRRDLQPDGRIVLRMEKTGRVHTVAVRDTTMAALLQIAVADDERLLPWRLSRPALHQYWRRLLVVAGLPVHRRNGLQKLRRTSASFVEAMRPGSATNHLGHKSADLARKHYLDPRVVSKATMPPPLPEPPKLLTG